MDFRQFYGEYADEWCPFCNKEQIIPAWKASTCPTCGERIIPCSVCSGESGGNVSCAECPLGA